MRNENIIELNKHRDQLKMTKSVISKDLEQALINLIHQLRLGPLVQSK